MKKICSGILVLALALMMNTPADAAFVIGGENGWQFSTDGFVNVFGVYQMLETHPEGVTGGMLGGRPSAGSEAEQEFQVRTGLLPTAFGFNIKSPTTKGVDYAVRLGIYPQIQNKGRDATEINPNVDFREVNFTADGAFGQVLAGRAINLYQAKNILTDMTLFSVGVVGPVNAGPTMGHIGYGYLYPNFDAQFRYTTPSLGGVKVAFSINDTHDIGAATGHNVPRFMTEVSYATTFTGGKLQTWVSGQYQTARFSDAQTTTVPATLNPDGTTTPAQTIPAIRPGGSATTIGGAGGVQVGLGGLDMLVSAYGGQALGMLGIQGADATDAVGKERKNWGFLTQVTYALPMDLKVGVNYGQSNALETDNDKIVRTNGGPAGIKTQQAVASTLTYNVNKFTQVIAEYTWAQDKWFDGQKQNANIIALGTFFYW